MFLLKKRIFISAIFWYSLNLLPMQKLYSTLYEWTQSTLQTHFSHQNPLYTTQPTLNDVQREYTHVLTYPE